MLPRDIANKLTFSTPKEVKQAYQGQLYLLAPGNLKSIPGNIMQFSKHLRDRVINGDITTSVRFWKYPRVMAGGRYRLDPGEVIVTSIREINFDDISESMARESGFACIADLLKTAQHGTGFHIYFIRFYFTKGA